MRKQPERQQPETPERRRQSKALRQADEPWQPEQLMQSESLRQPVKHWQSASKQNKQSKRRKAIVGSVAGLVAGLASMALTSGGLVASAGTGGAGAGSSNAASSASASNSTTSSTVSKPVSGPIKAITDVIVKKNVMVTMRDGTKLATDIYLPATGGPKFATLVTRTPYGKDGSAKEATWLAEHGYAVVVQDCRGVGNSQGTYYPFINDGTDGYDTIEWAASQPWSNGNVGTYGASALGIDQEAAALLNPPHLKAMFVIVATDNFFTEATYQGGELRQALVQGWMNGMNVEQLSQGHLRGLTPAEAKQVLGTIYPIYQNYGAWAAKNVTMPVDSFPYLNSQLMPSYQEALNPLTNASQNPNYTKWNTLNLSDKYSQIHVPVFHVGGFQDIFEAGVLGTYEGLQTEGGSGAKGNQKLLMGPWTHPTVGQGGTGTPWASNAAVNLDGLAVQWFDYWLKGINNHIMQTPDVQFYVTGSNKWETAQNWPLPQEKSTPYYLEGAPSGTVQSLNDGSLSTMAPMVTTSYDSYQYDPSNPTPTVGGNNLEVSGGPMDQSSVEKGVLTYTSAPLTKDLTIAGPLSATLYAASSAVDTDFTVKLTDVSPDGKSTLIEDGIVRAEFRDGQQQAEPLTPGQVYKFTVSLIAASHTFAKGDRIRVDIASSNYPRFAVNPNTGALTPGIAGHYVVATNSIYHDATHPSAINLPVVPSDSNGAQVNLTLNGEPGSTVGSVIHNSSSYLPVWYVMKQLKAVGFQTSWNGRVWRIAAPGKALGDPMTAETSATGATFETGPTGAIMANGQVVAAGIGRLVQDGTTYLPEADVVNALKQAGVTLGVK